MDAYQQQALKDVRLWQKKMLHKPTLFNRLSKRAQDKVNSWIPEKVHNAVTATNK